MSGGSRRGRTDGLQNPARSDRADTQREAPLQNRLRGRSRRFPFHIICIGIASAMPAHPVADALARMMLPAFKR